MKDNPDEFHLLTSSNNELEICINDNLVNSNRCEKLLLPMIDIAN